LAHYPNSLGLTRVKAIRGQHVQLTRGLLASKSYSDCCPASRFAGEVSDKRGSKTYCDVRFGVTPGSRRVSLSRRALSIAIGDPAARQIIGRHFDADAIANQNSDAMLAHLAGNTREHDMGTIVEADFKKCVGLLVDNRALSWNQIVFCQSVLLLINLDSVRRCIAASRQGLFSRLPAPKSLPQRRILTRDQPATHSGRHHTTIDNKGHLPAGCKKPYSRHGSRPCHRLCTLSVRASLDDL